VCCSQSCRGRRDLEVERDDCHGKAVDHVSNSVDGLLATTGGANQGLGKSRRSDSKMVTALQRLGERRPGCLVMRVAGVEKADDDAGVEMNQRHSRRNSSSSLSL